MRWIFSEGAFLDRRTMVYYELKKWSIGSGVGYPTLKNWSSFVIVTDEWKVKYLPMQNVIIINTF